MNILIKNVRIPLTEQKKCRNADILISQGPKGIKILEISSKIQDKNARIIEGEGDYILPAFTDLWADIYHGEKSERETVESGSLCAKWGGFSDILILAPEEASREKLNSEINVSAHCNIHKAFPICGIFDSSLKNAVYYGSEPYPDARRLREVMQRAKQSDSLLLLSPEPDPLYPNSCITEGRASALMKLPSEPASAEARCISKYLILAEESSCRVHLRGISCKKSVELIRDAKKCGVNVTASTSPVYFSLTDEDMIFIGSNVKVYPPLRGEEDRRAITQALADGTLDCIDSGHTPRTRREKGRNIINAQYGAEGLQSTFSAAVTYLLLPGYIDIYRLCELLCHAPARILGLNKNDINTECRGFNLVSVSSEFIFSENFIKGKSVNSPFINMSLCGNIRESFV